MIIPNTIVNIMCTQYIYMLTNIVVFILIIIGLILGIAPHNKLCAIPTMIGVNYCIPHWAFVYIMSPALIFWAYVMKHGSAGFIDFSLENLRDFGKNPNT